MTTYAWVNIFSLDDGNNSLSKLRARGFEILNTGMDFTVGSIFSDENEDNFSQETDLCFILCKIIIGKSYCKVSQNVIKII